MSDKELLENTEQTSTNEHEESTEKASTKKRKKNKSAEVEKLKEELEKMTEKYNELNDKYLRLAAEFDNYKKRTLKEKTELLKYGSEGVITQLVNILDDFERAYTSIKESSNIDSLKQGVELINNKFQEFLKQQGVKEIEAKNNEFNTDFHEAITRIPAQNDELKGKVIDVIQKGYMLHDKVIRFAKVVVGE
ncbi:MAG: nucleotide exchange factor GrpE [Bacteroidales bacterium]|nr:nucleotide exchange factor GrpE [Bacteroidales bacterium]